uniref:NAD(P)(+)--arginine ADP-ribosyltransferase n=1 Tax=Fundulus heteroclitus TaxID=8078 RepID=A0A3Q2TSD8_FUNHE
MSFSEKVTFSILQNKMMILISLCWMLSVVTDMVTSTDGALQLGMAEDSIDDMYFGCTDQMKNALQQKFSTELQNQDWNCKPITRLEKLKRFFKKHQLTDKQIQAICLYTGNTLYQGFNKQVREEGRTYGNSFPYHNLHFQLTSALQTLKRSSVGCETTYRRMKGEFDGRLNHKIRLGSFSSSSRSKTQTDFGHKTCLEINTCHGAFIKEHSKVPDEEEVLIPPYEMFTIKGIKKQAEVKDKDLSDCEKLFELESAGVHSNLNCRLVL